MLGKKIDNSFEAQIKHFSGSMMRNKDVPMTHFNFESVDGLG